jgi:hypothetical protein
MINIKQELEVAKRATEIAAALLIKFFLMMVEMLN